MISALIHLALALAMISAADLSPLSRDARLAEQSAPSDRSIPSTRPRVAVTGFPSETREAESALAQAFSRDARLLVIDRQMMVSALAGAGYDRSINMKRDEARRLGAAVGCDFFITGKAETLIRRTTATDSHVEALIGVMMVDGRSGKLAAFDFIAEKAATPEQAMAAALRSLAARASSYADQMIAFRAAREKIIAPEATERIEDLPEEGSSQSAGFKPPEFLNRVKPEYTEQADRADIRATVEASVIFRANGEVGQIEIIRWAGFGLDESAIKAIRQLKFKPATRDGQAVSVRATVLYNFRRIVETEKKP
jgi:TonB family protein